MGLLKWCSCLKKNQMEDVRILDFSHSHLVDVPPDVFQYERTLEELHLEANRITELPRQLFYCQELRVLYLYDNELKSIPPAINSMINLTKLDLSRNLLYTLNDNMKGLKNLRYLDLSMNGLEKLPEVVTSLIALQELYLNDTMMEFLPANFGRLVCLRILELRENQLLTLPKSISRLSNALQRIDIGQNEFSELPEVVGQLTNLTELWVDNNRIRRLPSNIGNLKRLIHADMNNNLLTSLNAEIGEWTMLQELSVSGNDLESIPPTIGQLRSLVSLKLDENQLQELPESIGQCEMLEELMLSHNDLSELPASIGRLRRLRILTVDENFLRSLPNELSSCTNLSILSVRGNQLTELPPDIGHMVNLRVVNIVNNFVTHLPVSLLNLQSLSALWINDNQSKPLMPLQKEYGAGGNIQLTCYMLPQTAGSIKPPQPQEMSGGDLNVNPTGVPSKSTTGAEKRRICFASEVNGSSEDSEEDRTVEEKNSEREDLIAPSPALTTGATVEPAAIRLMRSPTPYPKDLKMLAKYVRHAGTAGGNRNSRGNLDDTASPQRLSGNGGMVVEQQQQHQQGLMDQMLPQQVPQVVNSPPFTSSNYESELVVMPSPMSTPNVSLIKEARVTSSMASSGGVGGGLGQFRTSHEETRLSMDSQRIVVSQTTAEWRTINSGQQQQRHQDVVNNNNNLTNIQRSAGGLGGGGGDQQQTPPMQPPPYHIAKTYTKKSPEDLMIYDSFRNMKSQHQLQFEGVKNNNNNLTGGGGVQRALITPTPSITSATAREVQQIITNGQHQLHNLQQREEVEEEMDENRNNLPLPSPPPPEVLDVNENNLNNVQDNFLGSSENGNQSINSDTSLPPPPPPIATTTLVPEGAGGADEMDSLSILSKESSNTSPTKSTGGVKKSESAHSFIFGLHRNPRVLQYQIHYDSNSSDLGFGLCQLPNEDGIYVSEVKATSIANLYLKKMDKLLDVDGTDFTRMSLSDAKSFFEENHSEQNSAALNVMISRK